MCCYTPNSLRSKRFCGFSEQRKTEERDFDNFAAQEMGTSEKVERGGRGKELWNKKWSRGEGGGGKGIKRLPAKVIILKNSVRQPTEKSVLLIGAVYSVMIDVRIASLTFKRG